MVGLISPTEEREGEFKDILNSSLYIALGLHEPQKKVGGESLDNGEGETNSLDRL